MKRCQRCGKEFEEADSGVTPMEELGRIFLDSMGHESDRLCPECKEELGMLNIMGSGA
jgi:DNA-directed RNA polymerase subunit RPC12/RpoP